MGKYLIVFLVSLFIPLMAMSDESVPAKQASTAESEATDTELAKEEATKTMSGMSILGNEEAPKSLVIIPWKTSEIGADLGLSDTLDDRAKPVDKEVFLRELKFYQIRAGE